MTPEERAEARLTAEMLGASGRTDLLTTGLTLLAAAALIFGFGSAFAAFTAVAIGLAGRYLGFRVALDRRLFDDLADARIELDALDAALRAVTGGRAGGAARSVADRCRGARKLVAWHAAVTIGQVAAMSIVPLIR